MRPLTSKPPSINLSIQQSPKLTSHKWRTSAITNISRNTNNSNITLPTRTLQTVNHFISKKQKTKTKIKPMRNTGTNFPSQFLRRTSEQINCILKKIYKQLRVHKRNIPLLHKNKLIEFSALRLLQLIKCASNLLKWQLRKLAWVLLKIR